MSENIPINDKYHRYTDITIRFVAVLAVIIGIWQIRNAIRLPFVVNLPPEENVNLLSSDLLGGSDSNRIDTNKDTDADGLTDADEQNIYRTSAYLTDTDSDGLTDKQEVDKKTDPLCPEGQTCLRPALDNSVNTTELLPEGLKSTDLRTMLKQSGVSEDVLKNYDDATLQSLYQELVGNQAGVDPSTSPASGLPVSGAPLQKVKLTPEQRAMINNLSPADLRKFMIEGGASEEMLKKFKDEQLVELVKQLISE